MTPSVCPLRALGFHKKAMGKDIPQVPYAKLRKRPASESKGATVTLTVMCYRDTHCDVLP